MDITISLTEKQVEKITDFLKMFSININTPAGQSQPAAPAVPVMPKKHLPRDLTTTEKVLKVLERLWKKDNFVSYSTLMRNGHFMANKLKPALNELAAKHEISFFNISDIRSVAWDTLYITKPETSDFEKQLFVHRLNTKCPTKQVRRPRVPCYLVNDETGEQKYFASMNDAWVFLGIGRESFRPSARFINGYVYNGWRFVLEDDFNPEDYGDEK